VDPFRRLVIVVCLALSSAAYADRAEALFSSRCGSCHTLGKGQPLAAVAGMVDLTLIGRKTDSELRTWLANPQAVSVDTPCSARFDRAEIDALLGLFRAHAQSEEGIPAIPAAAYRQIQAAKLAPRNQEKSR